MNVPAPIDISGIGVPFTYQVIGAVALGAFMVMAFVAAHFAIEGPTSVAGGMSFAAIIALGSGFFVLYQGYDIRDDLHRDAIEESTGLTFVDPDASIDDKTVAFLDDGELVRYFVTTDSSGNRIIFDIP